MPVPEMNPELEKGLEAESERLRKKAVELIERFPPIRFTISHALALASASQQAAESAIKIMLDAAAKQDFHTTCTSCDFGRCCVIPAGCGLADGLILVAWLDYHRKLDANLIDLCGKRATVMKDVPPKAWYERRTPCVFLNDKGKCSVYEGRPVPCRAYFVNSDPKLCSTGDEGISALDTGLVKMHAHVFETVLEVKGRVTEPGMTTTIPGAVYAIGRNWYARDTWSGFRRRIERDWIPYEIDPDIQLPSIRVLLEKQEEKKQEKE